MHVVMKILSRIESMTLLNVFWCTICTTSWGTFCSELFKSLDCRKAVERVPQTRRQVSMLGVISLGVPYRIPFIISEGFCNSCIILVPVDPVLIAAFSPCVSTCSFAFIVLKDVSSFLVQRWCLRTGSV